MIEVENINQKSGVFNEVEIHEVDNCYFEDGEYVNIANVKIEYKC